MRSGTRVPCATSAPTHTHVGVDAHAQAQAAAHTRAHALPAPYIRPHLFLPSHFYSISAVSLFLSPRGPSSPKHESSSNPHPFTTILEVHVARSCLFTILEAMRHYSQQIRAGPEVYGVTRAEAPFRTL